ncbi:cold-shock protein [Cohnella lubricantis]|uniref:Cold-shock protein n=2 Tax=Cohnella lubricantis TaxID=2163172 RepID=A0A841TJ55_9BACL|nr:cold-shock protein [Cohnella lubricantis]MBB6678531.1 cold-shock protein [Cohnella lubricantis]MBP2119160.1 hypothetical protein [Cohnella lubricantis]
MHYSKKRPLEDVLQEQTAIWSCPNENCKGWMRDNFTFSSTPICSQCQAKMVKGERMLAAVLNTSPIHSK